MSSGLLFAAAIAVAILFLELTLKAFNVPTAARIAGLFVALVLAVVVYPRNNPEPLSGVSDGVVIAPGPDPGPGDAGPDAGKIFLDTSPSQIVAASVGKTGYQAEQLVAGYVGKWLRIDVVVRDVTTTGPTRLAIIGRSQENKPTDVLLGFDKKLYESTLSEVQLGSTLTAICTFGSVDYGAVSLDNCEPRASIGPRQRRP